MNRFLYAILLATVFVVTTGCAYVEERYQDVSNDPKYAVSYHRGESFRLRTNGRIFACPRGWTAEQLELWSPQVSARNAASPDYGKFVASVPAGSVVHIDGLEYSYTFSLPPVPGDSEILRAYGTVESSAGRWTHVRIPDDQNAPASFVPCTIVMFFPPDHDFLDPISAATKPAGR